MARFLPRHLARTLRRALGSFPVVLVTGARQTGKTTLLRRELRRSHSYVSLERPDVRQRALADPVGFFRDHEPPLILDEIQYAPELLHHVKERVDEKRTAGRWVLTGSQSLALMHGISQTLAGRVAVLTLDPVSVPELVGASPLPVTRRLARVFGSVEPATKSRRVPALGDWLTRGGFPEPRLSTRVDASLWFASYVQTHVERDVRSLLQVGDLEAFSRFVRLAAARSGGLLNLAELGRDAGVTAPTAKAWLSVLVATHLVWLLRPHHRNFGKRLVKAPKLYFLDPGLASWLLGLDDARAALQGPSAGALTESAVIGEWVKAFRFDGLPPPLYYWRSSDGLEVDVVIEHGGRLHGVEVKSTSTPRPPHAEALARWLELAGAGASGVLACDIPAPEPLRSGVRAVPWHLAW